MSSSTRVDPRGLRFAASLTSVVLAVALLASSPWNVTLVGLQAAVFALGAFGSLRRAPYGLVYARFVRPRLPEPATTEDARPPQFAQLVGLVFTVVAVTGFILGATVVAMAATTLALIAALLNATTGFCLGCETYLLIRRLAPAKVNA